MSAEDTRRLDWLEAHHALVNVCGTGSPHVAVPNDRGDEMHPYDHFYGATYRAAIDEAMRVVMIGEFPAEKLPF